MSVETDRILDAALKLPDEEQLELVEALLTAVDERGLRPFDESWLEEIRRRSSEYDAGKVTALSWSEVKEQTRREVLGGG